MEMPGSKLVTNCSNAKEEALETSKLIGPALDWAVAKCEGLEFVEYTNHTVYVNRNDPITGVFEVQYGFAPSRHWNQGGPIIGMALIGIDPNGTQWAAFTRAAGIHHGPTPLIAAMRCYVASKMGDEVDVPEELL